MKNYLFTSLLLALIGIGIFSVSCPASTSQADTVPQFFTYFGIKPYSIDEMAERYNAAIWHNHPDTKAVITEMRQKNSRFAAFMYRELFCILEKETPLKESVGQYAWIDKEHPEWFQLDANGNRVEIPDYPGRWMMNLNNTEWQDFWIAETLKEVKEGGWDGAFADDALTNIHAHSLPPLAGFPDDRSLQDAVYQFLKRAGDEFHKSGKLLTANVSNSYDFPGLWEKWLEVTDGLMEEHFAGDSWTWGEHVREAQSQHMDQAAKKSKWMFCMTYGPWEDHEKMLTSLNAYERGQSQKTFWSYRPYEQSDDPAWHATWNAQPD